MAVNFDDYLNRPAGDWKRVTLPEGHYFGRVKDWKTKESGSGKPMLTFSFTLDSAGDDVTGALPEGGVSGKVVSVNCMLDQDFGRAAAREVVEACGIVIDEAVGLGTYLDQTKGQPVKLHIKQRPLDKDDPEGDKTEDVKKVLSATA